MSELEKMDAILQNTFSYKYSDLYEMDIDEYVCEVRKASYLSKIKK